MSIQQSIALLDLFGNRHGTYAREETKNVILPYYIHTIDLMSHRGIRTVDIKEYNKNNPTCPYINLRSTGYWNPQNKEKDRIKNVFDFLCNCIDSEVRMYTKEFPPNKNDKFTFGGISFYITIGGLYRDKLKIIDLNYSDDKLFVESVEAIHNYISILISDENIVLRGIGCVVLDSMVDDYISYVNSIISK